MHSPRHILIHWTLPLVITLSCVAIQLADGAAVLRYERALIGVEPWRLVTGHLVHLGWNHLLLNLAGLMLIWALFGARLRYREWALACVVSALGISGGLYLLDSDLVWYVGLSGVLHGLLVLGALASLRVERRMTQMLLVIVAGKLLWEQFNGDSATSSMVGGSVIINSHLYGALAGLLCAPLIRIGRARPINS